MVRLLILILMCVPVLGCGDGGEAVAKRLRVLDSLGKAYQDYAQVHDRAAVSAAELVEHIRSQDSVSQDNSNAAQSLEEGDIVMVWKGDLGNRGENGLYVLGFEAGAPSTGGYVLMADGTVQLMTAKDFSSARMLPQVD